MFHTVCIHDLCGPRGLSVCCLCLGAAVFLRDSTFQLDCRSLVPFLWSICIYFSICWAVPTSWWNAAVCVNVSSQLRQKRKTYMCHVQTAEHTNSVVNSQIMFLAQAQKHSELLGQPIKSQLLYLPSIHHSPALWHSSVFQTQHTMAPRNCAALCPETKQSTTHEQHSGGGRGGRDGCEGVRETGIESEGGRERQKCGIVGEDKEWLKSEPEKQTCWVDPANCSLISLLMVQREGVREGERGESIVSTWVPRCYNKACLLLRFFFFHACFLIFFLCFAEGKKNLWNLLITAAMRCGGFNIWAH